MSRGQHWFWVGVGHCTSDRRRVVRYGGSCLSLKLIIIANVTLNMLNMLNMLIIIISLISKWVGFGGCQFLHWGFLQGLASYLSGSIRWGLIVW